MLLRCFSPMLLFVVSLCMSLPLHASALEALFAAVDQVTSHDAGEALTSMSAENVQPEEARYGNVYFSLRMEDDTQSNIPRFMMYLLTRYQHRKATDRLPAFFHKEGSLEYAFQPARKPSTISTLTEYAFDWYIHGNEMARTLFKEKLQTVLSTEESRLQFLDSFFEIGDWVKTEHQSDWCLHRIFNRKREKFFTFTSSHQHQGRHVEADLALSEISHIFLPLTVAEARSHLIIMKSYGSSF